MNIQAQGLDFHHFGTIYAEIRKFTGEDGNKNEMYLDKWIRSIKSCFDWIETGMSEQRKLTLASLKLSGDADQRAKHATSFEEMVQILDVAYGRRERFPTGMAQRLYVRQELLGMTVQSTIEDYINRFNTKATALPESLSEIELITYFIAKLPCHLSTRLTEEYCRGRVTLHDIQGFALNFSDIYSEFPVNVGVHRR